MFIVINKTHIVLAVLIVVGIVGMVFFSQTVRPVANITEKSVIIDPGHGGEDGGTQGTTGVLEKELNLKVALKLEKILTDQGIKCIMTRSEDLSIHDQNKESIRSKKVSDLKNRREIIETSGAAVFVSIHMNKFEQEKYWGAQVFYSKMNPQSKDLAEQTKQSLLAELADDNKREIKPSDDSIYLLKYTRMPAILVECGFLSNKEEEQRLLNDEYQTRLAAAISKSIIKWLDNNQ